MEPVGIFGAIRLSAEAMEKFCEEQGKALVDDVQYIIANRSASSWDDHILTPTNYYHHPGNGLLVQYEADTNTLFYLYILELRNPDAMAMVPSFEVLQHIAAYKDIDGTDFVVFSSSMPNLLIDPLWRAFAVDRNLWRSVDESSVPRHAMNELDRLSYKYYFDLSELCFNAQPGDDDSAWRYPDSQFPPQLLKFIGVCRPSLPAAWSAG